MHVCNITLGGRGGAAGESGHDHRVAVYREGGQIGAHGSPRRQSRQTNGRRQGRRQHGVILMFVY